MRAQNLHASKPITIEPKASHIKLFVCELDVIFWHSVVHVWRNSASLRLDLVMQGFSFLPAANSVASIFVRKMF